MLFSNNEPDSHSTKSRRRLRPQNPSDNSRYERPLTASNAYDMATSIKIPAGPFEAFSNEPISAWWMYVHPEGNRYFYNADNCVITGSNMLDPSVRTEVEVMMLQLVGGVANVRGADDGSVESEIVLELSGEEFCDYYCVGIACKTIYWLEPGGEWLGLPENASPTTIRLTLEQEYWIHSAFFPMHRALSVEDEECLRGALIFLCVDKMTAQGSTSHLTADDCRHYLSLFESCKDPTPIGIRTWFIARLMTTITRSRIHNYWGQEGARLDLRQSSVSSQIRPNTFTKAIIEGGFVQSLLFHSHKEYEKDLELIAVDDVVLPDIWQTFMAKCQRDWNFMMGVALMLLLANAITLGHQVAKGSVFNVTIISAVFTVASIAAALYQLQVHRGMEHSDAYVAVEYLQRNESSTLGFTPLAIRMALPYVLMIWAFMWFSIVVLLNVRRG